ncbi:MAG TPA: ATP phosphoribosyltransferase regulatory subunit, partial [Hyphomonadaceae bacterium]|nr:ATP phosphoribosyltransferase regulatory subunit [Hyphomonadaceae bacterium]
EPATLLPVEIVLELSGEAVRSRLCTFTDANGHEHCLRPDLTTPIARLVATGDLPVARYHASGRVYRLPPRGSNDPVEHQQIGFEWFGPSEASSGKSPEEDADALAVALEAARAGGAASASVRFGDVAIYHAVIDELGFSPQWKDRLRRAFSRRKGPRELLEGVASGQTSAPALAVNIGLLPEKESVRAVEQMLADIGAEPIGRTVEDIAERLRDKARDRAPDTAASAALIRYLSVSASAGQSVAALQSFARETGLRLTAALDDFSRRLDLITRADPPAWNTAVFSAEVGRRFEYYDGFVFELSRDPAFERPIVSGGRYDGLITRLSAGQTMATAIGAALRTDRLTVQGAQ